MHCSFTLSIEIIHNCPIDLHFPNLSLSLAGSFQFSIISLFVYSFVHFGCILILLIAAMSSLSNDLEIDNIFTINNSINCTIEIFDEMGKTEMYDNLFYYI